MLLSRYISIRSQFILLLLVVAASLFSIISVNVSIHSESSERLNTLEKHYYPALESAVKLNSLLPSLKQQFDSAVVLEDESALSTAEELTLTLIGETQKGASVLPEYRSDFTTLQASLSQYSSQARQLSVDFIELNGTFEELSRRAKANDETLKTLTHQSDKLREIIRNQVVATIQESESSASHASSISWLIGGILMVVLCMTSFAIQHSITRSIALVTEKMKEIASGNGDLTARIEYAGKDEISKLVERVNQFIEKLQLIIKSTLDSSQMLEKVSNRMEFSAQNTLDLNNQQQSQIEDVTHSINDMLKSIERVVEFAAQADGQAQTANLKAEQGADIVTRTSSQIEQLAEKIRDTASKISDLEANTNNVGSILSTIQNVAEQTNLLALNAAIEAARAGEHGRGFAVVADEVRVLASNTQSSATEINTLLIELQNEAHSAVDAMSQGLESSALGVTNAREAGQSLSEITTQVASITQVNKQIAQATELQHQTSSNIQQRLDDFNACSQQVSQSTSELESLSNELSHIVSQLSQSTSQFKV
ncbi:methyl-accepting chemotaxis protein [Vibrio sp. SCSIO 43132]|uniref:methyl-accepting chemotaxis protein n=1 Tax=Vibrio sp. SCSIO 43132 TaxID=2779363 RepID=UPI001CA8C4E9|nr:HAMP domain-containing methyl-accepting chemotaxis protein [Vibrio sp. SCSIO 43132]UAB69063.1 methyl-accepting chemotaxis protein [Vibrio sp. SCSIO 43132]